MKKKHKCKDCSFCTICGHQNLENLVDSKKKVKPDEKGSK